MDDLKVYGKNKAEGARALWRTDVFSEALHKMFFFFLS